MCQEGPVLSCIRMTMVGGGWERSSSTRGRFQNPKKERDRLILQRRHCSNTSVSRSGLAKFSSKLSIYFSVFLIPPFTIVGHIFFTIFTGLSCLKVYCKKFLCKAFFVLFYRNFHFQLPMRFQRSDSGAVLILFALFVPIILAGLRYTERLFDRRYEILDESNKKSVPKDCAQEAALAVARNYNPGLTLAQQREALYKVADYVYNKTPSSEGGSLLSRSVPGIHTSSGSSSSVKTVRQISAPKYVLTVSATNVIDNVSAWNPYYILWLCADKTSDPTGCHRSKFDEVDESILPFTDTMTLYQDLYSGISVDCSRIANGYPTFSSYNSSSGALVYTIPYASSSFVSGDLCNPSELLKRYVSGGNFSISSSEAGSYKTRSTAYDAKFVEISIADDDSNPGKIKVKTDQTAACAVPAQCNVDIVIVVPVNSRSCSYNTAEHADGSLCTDSQRIAETAIYRMAQACRAMIKDYFFYTRGVYMSLIPYAGKLSVSPDRAVDWTVAFPQFIKDVDQKIMMGACIYATRGLSMAPLVQSYQTNSVSGTSITDTTYSWGGAVTACPIMFRAGIALIEKKYGNNPYFTGFLFDSSSPATNDSYKYLRMNCNPCSLNVANLFGSICIGNCTHFLPNPYYMVEPTADISKIYELLGSLQPFPDPHNVSNFIFPVFEWADNFFQSWTQDPEMSAVSGKDSNNSAALGSQSKTTPGRKKAIILLVNKPDWFEPNEMTYLGFSDDYRESSSNFDVIDFGIDFSNTSGKFPDGTPYDGTIRGNARIASFSGSVARASNYYQCSQTTSCAILCPQRAFTKLIVEPVSSDNYGTLKFTNLAISREGIAQNNDVYCVSKRMEFYIEADQFPVNAQSDKLYHLNFNATNLRFIRAEIGNVSYAKYWVTRKAKITDDATIVGTNEASGTGTFMIKTKNEKAVQVKVVPKDCSITLGGTVHKIMESKIIKIGHRNEGQYISCKLSGVKLNSAYIDGTVKYYFENNRDNNWYWNIYVGGDEKILETPVRKGTLHMNNIYTFKNKGRYDDVYYYSIPLDVYCGNEHVLHVNEGIEGVEAYAEAVLKEVYRRENNDKYGDYNEVGYSLDYAFENEISRVRVVPEKIPPVTVIEGADRDISIEVSGIINNWMGYNRSFTIAKDRPAEINAIGPFNYGTLLIRGFRTSEVFNAETNTLTRTSSFDIYIDDKKIMHVKEGVGGIEILERAEETNVNILEEVEQNLSPNRSKFVGYEIYYPISNYVNKITFVPEEVDDSTAVEQKNYRPFSLGNNSYVEGESQRPMYLEEGYLKFTGSGNAFVNVTPEKSRVSYLRPDGSPGEITFNDSAAKTISIDPAEYKFNKSEDGYYYVTVELSNIKSFTPIISDKESYFEVYDPNSTADGIAEIKSTAEVPLRIRVTPVGTPSVRYRGTVNNITKTETYQQICSHSGGMDLRDFNNVYINAHLERLDSDKINLDDYVRFLFEDGSDRGMVNGSNCILLKGETIKNIKKGRLHLEGLYVGWKCPSVELTYDSTQIVTISENGTSITKHSNKANVTRTGNNLFNIDFEFETQNGHHYGTFFLKTGNSGTGKIMLSYSGSHLWDLEPDRTPIPLYYDGKYFCLPDGAPHYGSSHWGDGYNFIVEVSPKYSQITHCRPDGFWETKTYKSADSEIITIDPEEYKFEKKADGYYYVYLELTNVKDIGIDEAVDNYFEILDASYRKVSDERATLTTSKKRPVKMDVETSGATTITLDGQTRTNITTQRSKFDLGEKSSGVSYSIPKNVNIDPALYEQKLKFGSSFSKIGAGQTAEYTFWSKWGILYMHRVWVYYPLYMYINDQLFFSFENATAKCYETNWNNNVGWYDLSCTHSTGDLDFNVTCKFDVRDSSDYVTIKIHNGSSSANGIHTEDSYFQNLYTVRLGNASDKNSIYLENGQMKFNGTGKLTVDAWMTVYLKSVGGTGHRNFETGTHTIIIDPEEFKYEGNGPCTINLETVEIKNISNLKSLEKRTTLVFWDTGARDGGGNVALKNHVGFDGINSTADAQLATQSINEELVEKYGDNLRTYIIKYDHLKEYQDGGWKSHDYSYIDRCNSGAVDVQEAANEEELLEALKKVAKDIRDWAGYEKARVVGIAN